MLDVRCLLDVAAVHVPLSAQVSLSSSPTMRESRRVVQRNRATAVLFTEWTDLRLKHVQLELRSFHEWNRDWTPGSSRPQDVVDHVEVVRSDGHVGAVNYLCSTSGCARNEYAEVSAPTFQGFKIKSNQFYRELRGNVRLSSPTILPDASTFENVTLLLHERLVKCGILPTSFVRAPHRPPSPPAPSPPPLSTVAVASSTAAVAPTPLPPPPSLSTAAVAPRRRRLLPPPSPPPPPPPPPPPFPPPPSSAPPSSPPSPRPTPLPAPATSRASRLPVTTKFIAEVVCTGDDGVHRGRQNAMRTTLASEARVDVRRVRVTEAASVRITFTISLHEDQEAVGAIDMLQSRFLNEQTVSAAEQHLVRHRQSIRVSTRSRG